MISEGCLMTYITSNMGVLDTRECWTLCQDFLLTTFTIKCRLNASLVGLARRIEYSLLYKLFKMTYLLVYSMLPRTLTSQKVHSVHDSKKHIHYTIKNSQLKNFCLTKNRLLLSISLSWMGEDFLLHTLCTKIQPIGCQLNVNNILSKKTNLAAFV